MVVASALICALLCISYPSNSSRWKKSVFIKIRFGRTFPLWWWVEGDRSKNICVAIHWCFCMVRKEIILRPSLVHRTLIGYWVLLSRPLRRYPAGSVKEIFGCCTGACLLFFSSTLPALMLFLPSHLEAHFLERVLA